MTGHYGEDVADKMLRTTIQGLKEAAEKISKLTVSIPLP